MEDRKFVESDSDFASAESDQDQEKLEVDASNYSPKTDDVTTPMTSSQNNSSSRDKEEAALTSTQATDNEETTGNSSQPEQENESQVNEVKTTDSTSPPCAPVTSSQQITSDGTPEQTDNTPSSTNATFLPVTKPTSVAHDVSDKEYVKQRQNEQPSGGESWGWGSWGSVWSSVTNITESAGKGISSVISSVEGSLGIPSPTSMADEDEGKIVSKLADDAVEHDVPSHDCNLEEDDMAPKGGEKMIRDEPDPLSSSPTATFWNSLGTIASSVQSTSVGIVAGSLGALESIGKKTMDILSEGDPGLRKKRELLGGKPMTLSELVREAKAEVECRKDNQDDANAGGQQTRITFSLLFDEYQGVVHLEALELLSTECGSKMTSEQETVMDDEKEKLKEQLAKLSDAFTLSEEEERREEEDNKEFSSGLQEVVELLSGLSSFVKVDKLTKTIDVWRKQAVIEYNESDCPTTSIEVLYERGMRSLAETTSVTIDLFRKIAEVSLLPNASDINLVTKATHFNRVTILVTAELESLASIYSQQLMTLSKDDSDAPVTSLYLEASNSSSYVRDAFQLLLPVLQYNCLQTLNSSSS